MTIKFEKETRRLKTMICLSGRLQAKHLEELKTQLEGARSRVALDLNGVTLVDVEIAGGGQGSAPLVLSARMRPDSRARCGDTVRLVAAAERLHLFDPMTEEALAWPAPRP